MQTYQLGSPSRWVGSTHQAATDAEAIAWAKAGGDEVLDIMDWQDEDGQPVILLVVADES
jgi:hypothetical protein